MAEARHFQGTRTVVWEAIRTYAVPLGLLGTTVKLWEEFPPGVTAAALLILPGYIIYEVNRNLRIRRRGEREFLEKYASISRLRPASNQKSNSCRFVSIEQTVYVNRPDARETVVELGMNVSSADHKNAVRVFATDTPTDPKAIGCRAWLTVNQEPEIEVAPHCEAFDDGRRFVVTLGFRGALVRPSNLFRLRWQYSLPGSVSRNRDHWICGRTGSDLPIGKLCLKACFPVVPADVQLIGAQTRKLERIAGPSVETDDGGQAWHAYSAEIEQASAQEYIWEWRLE